jgi:nucleoside-triphosphatase THEP1
MVIVEIAANNDRSFWSDTQKRPLRTAISWGFFYFMKLNTEQENCRSNLLDFIQSAQNGFFLIDGEGGTGKTTVVTSIIKDPKEILFLGATNKVCNNLKQSLKKNGVDLIDMLDIKVKTIARFLNFNMKKDEYNNNVITMRMPDIDSIPKIIVIDEVSMLSQEQVSWILKLRQIRKVILIGDKMQIPPIEDKYRENGFLISYIYKYIDYNFTLTLQNRQSSESNLYASISDFRKSMSIYINYKDFAIKYVDNKDIFLCGMYSEELKYHLQNEKYTAIAYKNNTVTSFAWLMNGYKNPNQLHEGDVVYFKSLYRDNEITFYTSEQVEILEISEGYKTVFFPDNDYIEIPILEAKIKVSEGIVQKINISKGYKKTMEKLYSKFYYKRSKLKNAKEKAEINTFYNDVRLSLAELAKPYSITCHKAQGSSYDNIIIPIFDFVSNREYKDSNQLFYVAMSRAKKKIIFVTHEPNYNELSNRVEFTQEERHEIASKFEFLCQGTLSYNKKCEKEFNNVREFDLDHILPLKNGGKNTINNLQILCKQCHKNKTYERFI